MEPKFKIGEMVECQEHGTRFKIHRTNEPDEDNPYGFVYYDEKDHPCDKLHMIKGISCQGVPEYLLERIEDECPFKVGDWVKLVKGKDIFICNESNPFFDETNIIGKILQIKIRNNNWCKPFNRCKYNIYVLWNNGIKNVYPEDALEKHEYKVGDKVEVKLIDGSWVENEISKVDDDGDIRLKDISYKLANNLNAYIESDNLDIIRPVQEKVYGESEINKHIESYLEKKENESTFTNVSAEPLTKEKLRECFYHDCVKPKVDMGVKGSFLHGDEVRKYVGYIKEIESNVIRLYGLNLDKCDWNTEDWGCGINEDGYINSNGLSGEYLTTLDGRLLNIIGVYENECEKEVTKNKIDRNEINKAFRQVESKIFKEIYPESNEKICATIDAITGENKFIYIDFDDIKEMELNNYDDFIQINGKSYLKSQVKITKEKTKEDKTMNFSICDYIEEILTALKGVKVIIRKKVREDLICYQHEISRRINSEFWEDGVTPTKERVLEILKDIKKDKEGK